ncbi:glycosyltransferase family 39 protein [Candidatus Woesebacteria bacterium]|nr:glycosyltransferase family 39 protein [Candidatus Woesebacteria bacterium]
MEKIALKIKNWVRQNPKEAIILGVILLFAAFLRLYRISEYMTFLGDEGRDAIIVRRLLVNFDPILIGPGTSIGNMYLGPLYYYLMAPALFLANYSPVGPSVQIALLGVGTTFFIWYIARVWFGKTAGIIAALFYALAPTVIIYSRSSWNPNIMPFFSLLTIWGTGKFWQERKFRWLPVIGMGVAFALQSHYLGLLLIPVVVVFWLSTFFKIRKSESVRHFVRQTIYGIILFLALMSPIVIFDARHGWRNFAAMRTFFTERQTTVSARPWKAIPKIPKLSYDITTRLVAGKNETAGKITFVTIIVLSIFVFAKRNSLKDKTRDAFGLLSVWLAVALIGLGLYKQEIYDHYYGFFFSAPFLLLGGISQYIVQSTKDIGKIALFVVLGLLFFVNLQNSPLKYPPNRQLQRSIEVAKKIEQEVGKEKFNLAVIAERNYEDGYQYFLEKRQAPVIDIDAQRPETVTNQLFVVCELPKEKCQPTTSPKAEVANFGWSKIAGEWEVFGVTVYKLVHSD